MKQKDLIVIAAVAVITSIFSFVVSGMLFSSPKKNSQVPIVDSINKSMPDIVNDPLYSSFLNDQALDPTQPVKIGPSSNTKPFNSQ